MPTIFKDKFVLDTLGKKHQTTLKVDSLTHTVKGESVNPRFKGKLVIPNNGPDKGAKKGFYCEFIYDAGLMPNPVGLRYRDRQADVLRSLGIPQEDCPNFWVDTVKSAINTYVSRMVRDNPNTGEEITEEKATFVSENIYAAHIRHPHLKQFKGKTQLILCRATVVNPSKLSQSSLLVHLDAVNTMNELARLKVEADPNISRGNFNDWVKNELH